MNKISALHRKDALLGVIVLLCIACLALGQGGYFPLAACGVGLVACAAGGISWLRKSRRAQALPLIPLLFVLLVVVFVASAGMSGFSLTTLAEAGSWVVCAGVSLLVAAMGEDQYALTNKAIAWLAIVTACAGMLTYAGWLPIVGGMVEDRLQFTFQYANAAAAWYGVGTYLCLLAPNARLKSLAFVPATALLLTQSGGGLVVFALVAVVLGVLWARAGKWGDLLWALVYGAVAAILFVVFKLVAPLGVVAIREQDRIEQVVTTWDARKTALILVGALAGATLLAIVLLPHRVTMATASLVERGYQVRDSITLWSTNPLLGIGPDNWQYLYPWVQTAPYAVTVAHSSAVQVLLDAGLLGFACLVAACVLGVRGLWRNVRSTDAHPWSLAQLCAVAFLLIHSAIEFDLQFASLACLLALLLCGPTSPRMSLARPMPVAKGALAGALCLALCLPFCVIGLLCSATSTAMKLANQQQRYDACIQLFEGVSLARIDVAAQEEYLRANFETQRYNAVTNTYEHIPAPSDAGVLYAAIAYNVGGNTEKAAQTLADRLEATRYDAELLESAKRYAERFGIDPSQKARFDAAVATNEQLITSSEVAPA